MTLWTRNRNRSSASTGARISPSRFSPTSPKGGFVSSGFDAARYVDENYGYRTESYYRKRLLGKEASDYQWRYDLNKHLIGRDYHWKPRYEAFPTYGKKKWIKTAQKNIQKGTKFRGGKFRSWTKRRGIRKWCRQCRYWTNKWNRCNCSYRRKSYFPRSSISRY